MKYTSGCRLALRAATDGVKVPSLDIVTRHLQSAGNPVTPPLAMTFHLDREHPEVEFITDPVPMGHPCNDVFEILVLSGTVPQVEFRIADTQTKTEISILHAGGWQAFSLPDACYVEDATGLRVEWRGMYGFVD
jgi:hypothetical protein